MLGRFEGLGLNFAILFSPFGLDKGFKPLKGFLNPFNVFELYSTLNLIFSSPSLISSVPVLSLLDEISV